MYTLINGSQKIKESNSLYFLNYISNYLEEYSLFDLKKDNYNNILDSIENGETIILAFPLYVDSPTSLILKVLDYIYDNKIDLTDKKFYVVINCGFREGEQNITALNIIKRWCGKVNAKYLGSLLIGAGEIVGNPFYKFITKKAHKKLHEFSVKISRNEYIDTTITTMDLLNNNMYIKLANHSWNRQGKKNKLTKKDIKSF